MAKILTYPQKVYPANIELMRKLVMNGPEIHPGANFVEVKGSKLKKYLRFGNRPAIARDLKVSIYNKILFYFLPNCFNSNIFIKPICIPNEMIHHQLSFCFNVLLVFSCM